MADSFENDSFDDSEYDAGHQEVRSTYIILRTI